VKLWCLAAASKAISALVFGIFLRISMPLA
jgi:hypothetical protein